MEEEPQGSSIDAGKLVGGLIVLALGAMFLADQLDLSDFHGLMRLWPLIVIGFGIAKLGAPHTRERVGSAIWTIAIGGWLLVSSLELWGLHWGNSWPLLLIIVGVSMLARSFFPCSTRDNTEEASDGNR